MAAYADRSHATESPPLRVWVDRERARFGAWYEMFPRSAGADPPPQRHVSRRRGRLPRIADLGFDVVYLPPIHPIGTQLPQGTRTTALSPAPAIPAARGRSDREAGGHTAIEPGLGTLDDFVAFRDAAERLGLEIALDLAFQCSPDHPWVREHPGVVPPSARRHDQVRRESAEEVPGHLSARLRVRRLARALARAARRDAVLDRARRAGSSASTTRTPSRSASGSG